LVTADLYASQALERLAWPVLPCSDGAGAGEPRLHDKLVRPTVLVAMWIGEGGHAPMQPIAELPP
jgi:hypothetical protein